MPFVKVAQIVESTGTQAMHSSIESKGQNFFSTAGLFFVVLFLPFSLAVYCSLHTSVRAHSSQYTAFGISD